MKHHTTKKHSFWIYIFSLLLVISLTSCMSPKEKEIMMNGVHYKQLNLLPMYGAEYEPYIKKTEAQKEKDKEFIASIIESEGSRKVGARRFTVAGWLKRQEGDARVSMMRFNQAWLLDPDYYGSYWGFGTLMLDEKKPEKASFFLEKAMALIDEENEKSNLFAEAARAYGWHASIYKKSDSKKSKELYKKANGLIDDALNLDTTNDDAYRIGGILSYKQGNYVRAWMIVKKSRETGAYKFDVEFIEKLKKELPEP